MYAKIIKPVLFRLEPEKVHDLVTSLGEAVSHAGIMNSAVKAMYSYNHPMLESEVMGIRFRNPVGLAAGFDKNARLMGFMPSIGFGFEEVGSITAEPCKGNPRPRLWRLPADRALIVNYGLANMGAKVLAEKLKERGSSIPIGISVAKTNDDMTEEQAIEDYKKAYALLDGLGGYTAVNVSCPNTSDGQTWCYPGNMRKLLNAMKGLPHKKPVLVKIKPDHSLDEMDEIVSVLKQHRWVNGIIISNLTRHREGLKASSRFLQAHPQGGISGKPVEHLAEPLIRYAYHRTKGKLVIVGCGGIFSAEDAYRKIKLGSSLVQLITGMIYKGPGLIKEINKGLVRLMKADGYRNISEAIGANN
ncbi:quinone-dependent dihydroorotate dehydrogenase [Candidatus Woesearchaeota archaeon]|nr:quinone-dependent dihydroorotate dehydrogenase [Candidatus Woesearchaeota archaeon]